MATGISNTSGLDEIEQILLCQICLEQLKDRNPRVLACGHTFCESCLKKMEQGIHSITCPNCRHETVIPEKGISDLPLNYSAEHANEMVRFLGQIELCKKCWVKGEFVNAVLKCEECDWKLCHNCKQIHDNLPGYSSHPIKSLGFESESIEDNGDYCRKHRYVVKMYCHSCICPLCQTCLLEGQHDSHHTDIVDIDQALQLVHQKLAAEKASLQVKMDKANGLVKYHQENMYHAGQIKETIRTRAASMKVELDRQVAALEEKLESIHLPSLEQRLKESTSFLEKAGGLIESINNLEQSPSSRVLQHGQDLLTKLNEERETFNIQGESSVFTLTEQTIPPWIGEIETAVGQVGGTVSSLNKTQDSERSPSPLDSQSLDSQDAMPLVYLLKAFSDPQIMCCGGIAILNPDCAVFVAESEKGLVLANSITGDCSHFSQKVNTVSTKGTDVTLVGYSPSNQTEGVSLVRFLTGKFETIKRYPFKCDAASRAYVDSQDDIIITCLEKNNAILKKINPDGDLVWKRQVDADLFHLYISVVMLQDEERIIVSDEKKGKVEILTSDGNAERTLELYEGPGFKQPAPRQATTSHRGTILVADFANHTVSEYSPGGAFIRHVLTEDDGIKYPCIVACSEQGRLWLTEYNYSPPWRWLLVYQLTN